MTEQPRKRSSQPLLRDLVCLKVPPTKWYQLGLQLNISKHQLDVIKVNNPGNIETCILEMFDAWLNNTAGASYAELESALNRIGEHSVAAHVLHSSSATMPQATRAGSGFQGPPLPIQPSGGCTPNGSASNRIGQQQQPVDQTDGVPYREQISAMVQPSNEHRPSGATNGNGQQQQQIHLDQNEKPAFGKEKLKELVTLEENGTDVKASGDEFIQQYCQEVKFVLQAANETERVAIISKLDPPTSNDGTKCDKILSFFQDFKGRDCHGNYTLGIFGGYKAALVQTEQGGKCRYLIEATLELFPNVFCIIGVGVAYGGNKDATSLGDVLVSEKIAELDTFKFKSEGIISRGVTVQVSGKLHTIFCKGNNWFSDKFACTEGASPRYSKAHVGTIISGSFLVDNEKVKHKLWDNSIEAIGGEMEGHVLMDIIKQRKLQVNAIIIKGVCDFGDGKKNDKWQVTAALAAVEYTHYRLTRTKGTLFPETTQTNGPALRVVGEGTAAMVQPFIELPSSGALSGQQPQLDRGQFGPPIQPSGGHPPKGSVDCTDGVPYHEQLYVDDHTTNLCDLMNDVAAIIPAKWRSVGVQLKLPNGTLDEIQAQNAGKPDECKLSFEQVLARWRNLGTSPYTWETMINALKSRAVGEVKLAEGLNAKY